MAAVEVKKVVPLDDAPRRPRLGRPLGAKGPQIKRVKRRLALLIVLGRRNGQIAKVFGVSVRTIRAWVADAEVQREIATVQQEFLAQTERKFMALYRKSIDAMAEILEHGGERTRLRAVELVWTAVGRLPPKGARVTICNHNQLAIGAAHRPQPGSLGPGGAFDREDYEATIRPLIRAERERLEREKAEKHEAQLANGDSPAP